jgi:hypothetical protein
MKNRIALLYESFKRLPFPALGGQIGDFPLYDSLLAGFAHSFLTGSKPDAASIPLPDSGTIQKVRNLRRKKNLSEEERLFINYFESIESLRSALEGALRRTPRKKA